MSTQMHRMSRLGQCLIKRPGLALGGSGLLTAVMVWLGTSRSALILQSATGTAGKGDLGGGGPDIIHVVDQLLTPALIIVVALAPLAIAWGAGMMIFGGKHGPQIMGSSIVAVVLVAAAKGIAA